jgi:hypothetical protein
LDLSIASIPGNNSLLDEIVIAFNMPFGEGRTGLGDRKASEIAKRLVSREKMIIMLAIFVWRVEPSNKLFVEQLARISWIWLG